MGLFWSSEDTYTGKLKKDQIYLLRKFSNILLQKGEIMDIHINEILCIVDKLTKLGIILPGYLVAAFISSLPGKYSIQNKTEKISIQKNKSIFNFVINWLLKEDHRQVTIFVNEKSDYECTIKNLVKLVKGPIFCTFCKTLNHYKRNCRKLKKVLRKQAQEESQRAEEICNQRMAYCDAEAFQPKKLRKPGVTILKEILKSIKLDENLIRENNEILQMFLSSFIEEMKNTDKIFKLLYQRPHFTGSYYSDLRISKPDEFDINLVLHLPFKPYEFEVLYHSQVPSYSKYALKNPAVAAINYPELCKLLFENGYLIPEKVRKWIQSVIDRTMCTYKRQIKSIGDIRFSSSGPARTIRLIKYTGDCIDIDLVPAIPCTLETKQPGIDGRVRMKLGATLETFLVPKPFSPSGQAPVNSSEISRLWRTHFPVSEEQLIHNKGCVKPVIKLLKLLRDKNNWKILASYYLKTVVMWMLLENSNEEYWKEDKLDERFIEALKKLLAYVKAQNIPYFFSKKNNLLSKLQYGEAVNISGKLSSIINAVERDPFNYWKEFGVFPTFTIWNAKNKYSKL